MALDLHHVSMDAVVTFAALGDQGERSDRRATTVALLTAKA